MNTFLLELLGALYDEDLKKHLKECPRKDCPYCVAMRAELLKRKAEAGTAPRRIYASL